MKAVTVQPIGRLINPWLTVGEQRLAYLDAFGEDENEVKRRNGIRRRRECSTDAIGTERQGSASVITGIYLPDLPQQQQTVAMIEAAIGKRRRSRGGWLSIREAAPLIGYSEKGLRKLVMERRIRFNQTRYHGRIVFRKQWLQDFNESHTHSALDGHNQKVQRVRSPKPRVAGVHKDHGLGWSIID
jgi:hypothetical protein